MVSCAAICPAASYMIRPPVKRLAVVAPLSSMFTNDNEPPVADEARIALALAHLRLGPGGTGDRERETQHQRTAHRQAPRRLEIGQRRANPDQREASMAATSAASDWFSSFVPTGAPR